MLRIYVFQDVAKEAGKTGAKKDNPPFTFLVLEKTSGDF